MWRSKWPPRSRDTVMLLREVFHCQKTTRNHHLHFNLRSPFNSFKDHCQPSPDPTLMLFTEQLSHYHVLIMTRVKSGGQGRCRLTCSYVIIEDNGGLLDGTIFMSVFLNFLNCPGILSCRHLRWHPSESKTHHGSQLMRDYFTYKIIQSLSNNNRSHSATVNRPGLHYRNETQSNLFKIVAPPGFITRRSRPI